MLESILVRVVVVILFITGAVNYRPASEEMSAAALAGGLVGGIVVLCEVRLRRAAAKRLFGMMLGVLAGLVCAALAGVVLSWMGESADVRLAQVCGLLLFGFLGGSIGFSKGDALSFAGGVPTVEAGSNPNFKILDTSVVIDGRIADIADTGFLDGVILVPQFVLHELQMVADSADGMKRARGRRGLDILQRIQKMPNLRVQITEEDFPAVKEVDMKLIELAKVYGCKIVTNDFNLNKVAQLRGVEVLNINELANSLKPIVLPGETMRVFILKEGKESNQGVAYLDDGTMVVVDNARRMISKTIDVSVTSVLQTTAGKMIFGKHDDRAQTAAAATAGAGGGNAPRRDTTVGEN